MGVAVDAVLFVAGLGLLGYGADRAVVGATDLARGLGVSPLLIGLSAISIGTTLPEAAAAVAGTLRGAGDLVMGGIIGSATSQITLAAGLVGLAAPFAVPRRQTHRYGGAMLGAMGVMVATVWDGTIHRWEALLLAALYATFLLVAYRRWEDEPEDQVEGPPSRPLWQATLWLVVGMGLVVAGAFLAVEHGLALAEALGASTYLIGLLVGLGTSLPEVVVAGLSSWRDRGGLSVGTLLGSNVADPLMAVGVGALVRPITVADTSRVLAGAGLMIAITVAALAVLAWRRRVGRRTALLLLALYLPVYLVR